jgi:hypothetical protein
MTDLFVSTYSVANKDTMAYQAQTELLQAQLIRDQQCMKMYAFKNREECQFMVGDQVLLKLQQYAQQSVVNCPYPKLSYKYFGPYKVLENGIPF